MTTTVLQPFFWDHTGEVVPEENFWTLWCKGRLTEADTLTIQLGTTPSGLTSAHLHHPPIFVQAGCPSCRPTNSVKALKATSAFRLWRKRQSSPQRCYLHHLHTMKQRKNKWPEKIQLECGSMPNVMVALPNKICGGAPNSPTDLNRQ